MTRTHVMRVHLSFFDRLKLIFGFHINQVWWWELPVDFVGKSYLPERYTTYVTYKHPKIIKEEIDKQ